MNLKMNLKMTLKNMKRIADLVQRILGSDGKTGIEFDNIHDSWYLSSVQLLILVGDVKVDPRQN